MEKNYDAEKGCKLAQEKVDGPFIKRVLVDKVQQRYGFGHELKTEIMPYEELLEKVEV